MVSPSRVVGDSVVCMQVSNYFHATLNCKECKRFTSFHPLAIQCPCQAENATSECPCYNPCVSVRPPPTCLDPNRLDDKQKDQVCDQVGVMPRRFLSLRSFFNVCAIVNERGSRVVNSVGRNLPLGNLKMKNNGQFEKKKK